MAASFLQQLEKVYFARKAGGALPTTPLNHAKREYFGEFLGVGITPQHPLHQLEKLWLAKVITDAGATPTDFNSIETLWKQAVMTLSITPSKYLNDNKILFYQNAP